MEPLGAIIAAAMCINGWSIENCITHFESFARRTFQRQWWWPRIPVLSQIVRIVASVLLDSQYSGAQLEQVLQPILGARSMLACSKATEMGTKLGIPVTTIREARACVFTNYNGVGDRRDDTGGSNANLWGATLILVDYHILKPKSGLSRIPLWEM